MTALTDGQVFTQADLDSMPDDGHRHELVDGLIVVTPSPSPLHQMVTLELALLLRRSCPPTLKVLTAPLDVALADDTVIQPDLFVADPVTFTERRVVGVPLLAIEVLSPSTRLYDLTTKKSALQRAGCPHYWVVDPVGPSITAWELREGAYVMTAHVVSDEMLTTNTPLSVSFRPSELLA